MPSLSGTSVLGRQAILAALPANSAAYFSVDYTPLKWQRTGTIAIEARAVSNSKFYQVSARPVWYQGVYFPTPTAIPGTTLYLYAYWERGGIPWTLIY